MEIEHISEPIGVLADCTGGQMRPLRFAWSGRTYKVSVVNAEWIDRQGDIWSLHYSIQSNGQTYLIHFDGKEAQWWLDETILE